MTEESSIEIEFYKQQLDEARLNLSKDSLNDELKELVRHLELTIAGLEASTGLPDVVSEEKSAVSIVGKTCEVYFDGKWFNSEIISLRNEENGIVKVIVKLMGVNQTREYDLKDIRLLPDAEFGQFPIGKSVQAIWADDGLWYPATISDADIESGVFLVRFDGFEAEATTVKPDRVREPVIFPRGEKSKEVKTYTTPAGYIIPEKLRIDKNRDSDETIAEKKRKAHQLKSHQRSDKISEEATAGKQKWQQFKQKIARH